MSHHEDYEEPAFTKHDKKTRAKTTKEASNAEQEGDDDVEIQHPKAAKKKSAEKEMKKVEEKTSQEKVPKKKRHGAEEFAEEEEPQKPKTKKGRRAEDLVDNEADVEETTEKAEKEKRSTRKPKETKEDAEVKTKQKDNKKDLRVEKKDTKEDEPETAPAPAQLLRANTAEIAGEVSKAEDGKQPETSKRDKMKIYKARKGRFYRSLASWGLSRLPTNASSKIKTVPNYPKPIQITSVGCVVKYIISDLVIL